MNRDLYGNDRPHYPAPRMNSTPPTEQDLVLPPQPERPDCCLGGCAVCVLDGYQEEVERWEQEVAALRERAALHVPSPPAES